MEAKEPCIDCLDINTDEYGYICDLACGKRTAWLNYMEGLKAGVEQGRCEVVEWGNELCPHSPTSYGNYRRHQCRDCWQATLKE